MTTQESTIESSTSENISKKKCGDNIPDSYSKSRYIALPDGYISELMRSVSLTGKALVVMLRAYFDDSGDQDLPGVFAVAGYIGKADQWDHFQHNWDEILAAFNRQHGLAIRCFHMTDLVAGQKDFRGVDQSVRALLLSKLCKLARVRSGQGIGAYVRIEDYIKVFGEPSNRSPSTPAPLALCAEGAFLLAKRDGLKSGRSREDSISYIIEKGSKYRGELLDGFEWAIRDPELYGLFELDSISQGPKQLAGLQLADLHAWALAADAKGMLDYRPVSDDRPRIPDVFRSQLQYFLNERPHSYWPWEMPLLEAWRDSLPLLPDVRYLFREKDSKL